MRDLSPLIAGRLVWFWYGQAESTRRRIQLNRNLVEMYATKGEGDSITTPAEYEARIAKDEERLLFIKARVVALDPTAADRIAQEDPSRWGPAPSTDTP